MILLAVLVGAILLGYIAEEEAKGRRFVWAEEPLAETGKPMPAEEAKAHRAA